ncbi:hypothetical protein vBRpoPV13_08 [Ruegeria phage vB_RpoP-V13]|uniref:Large ribosomal subunit protein bL12 C-terminal domain-containing protein n=1 Tax=Ruegeria phage vB_RpoP-V13 TaxID=2218612 RepID=A0A2Z4QGI8_9CAUD|nr:hypothetical protein HYP63_gp08 [Ruegeria phage vB_RpoP-V13]AWY09365.1 hypothetical protein vBRpoPV13_08 [Ruegeria phage vB_RpoP-V13]
MIVEISEETAKEFFSFLVNRNAELEESNRHLQQEKEDALAETTHYERQYEIEKERADKVTNQNTLQFEEMMNLIDPNFVNHKKIDCIKYVRTITRCGLKEAKDFFEQVWTPAIRAAQSARDSGREVDLTAAREQLKELFNG